LGSGAQLPKGADQTDALVPFVADKSKQSSFGGIKKVKEDLARITKQKQDQAMRTQQAEEQKLKKSQIRKTSLRKQIEKRRVELGVQGFMEASSPRAILWSPHETGDAQKSQRPVQPQLESRIAYLDLDVDFEECERQACLILIKK
jgi:hypothetical protein